MKKHKIFFLILILNFSFVFGETFSNYTKSFFGVYGRKASIMGKMDGSAFEVWIYPYKIFHNYKTEIVVNGNKVNILSKISNYEISDYYISRKYVGESWKVDEKIFVSYDDPIAYIVYEISNIKDIEFIITFKPDLSPMWPASFGGKFSWWNDKGFFTLSEAKWKNFAFIGFPKGMKEGILPAHKLPGGKLKYKIELKKGVRKIVVPVSAGYGKYENIEKYLLAKRDKANEELAKRIKILKAFKEKHLSIKSSDKDFDFAINSAIMKTNFAFVKNPYLGKGLVAGYGLSENSERPGFAWYFGGDGVINSLAILDYGDFEGVGKEIEFLFKYQRKDGKIPHEISQGARFVNWFEDYGFAYFHGDTTLYFAGLLGEYLRYSGDLNLIKRYENKIKLLMDWVTGADKDKDGIVETKFAGTGASETGPLRRMKIKTDILLAGLSVKSWKELSFIWNQLGNEKRYKISKNFYKKSSEIFESMFWNKNKNYYDYAIKDKGRIEETTIWPSIPMRFGIMDKTRGRKAAETIASPSLSSDWGVRFLSSDSKYYDPLSYNNGAVWPFLTGFSSLALYRYENGYYAYSLLKNNLNIIKDFDYGYATELLSGDSYTPLEQSVNNQIWSYGTTISAFTEGLLGFSPDSIKRTVYLSPEIPLSFKSMSIKNLRVGEGFMDIDYRFDKNKITYFLKMKNLKGYKIIFSPELYSEKYSGEIKRMIDVNSDNFKFVSEYSIRNYAYPVPKNRKIPGDISGNPIISCFKSVKDGFILKVWNRKRSEIKIITDYDFVCKDYGVSNKIIRLESGKDWKLQTIKCKKRRNEAEL